VIGDGAISAASSILAWVLAFVPLSPVVDVADTIGAVAGWLSPYTAGTWALEGGCCAYLRVADAGVGVVGVGAVGAGGCRVAA
jgi:hypothetical protein